MEKLVDDGLVKSIGVSNFTVKKLGDLHSLPPRIMPVCNQVEVHPFLPQNKLIEYCKQKSKIFCLINPFLTNVPILYPLKTPEKL